MQMRLYYGKGGGIRKVGGRWRVPTTLIVLYKYIKYAIKIVNFSFAFTSEAPLRRVFTQPRQTEKVSFPKDYENGKCLLLCCFFSTTEEFQSAYSWLCALNNINIQCLYLPMWTPWC